MATIQSIRAAIKAKLDTLKGADQPLGSVYDYFTTKPDSFPCAMFEPGELDSEYNTTCDNERTYPFDLYIQNPTTEEKRPDTINIILDLFDTVVNAFDKDFTLGGEVLKVSAVTGTFGTAVEDHGPVYYTHIKIECTVLFNIKS